MSLSMLPAANNVFSMLIAMSEISADAPLRVASKRPSIALHTLTNKSSAPCKPIFIVNYSTALVLSVKCDIHDPNCDLGGHSPFTYKRGKNANGLYNEHKIKHYFNTMEK